MGLGAMAATSLCQLACGHLGHVCQAFPQPALTPSLALPLSSHGHCSFRAIVCLGLAGLAG